MLSETFGRCGLVEGRDVGGGAVSNIQVLRVGIYTYQISSRSVSTVPVVSEVFDRLHRFRPSKFSAYKASEA